MSGIGLPEVIVIVVLIGIPVAIVLAIVKLTGRKATKPCASCGAPVQKGAMQCRFCGRGVAAP